MKNLLIFKKYGLEIFEIITYSILFLLFVRLITVQFTDGPDYAVHVKIIDQFISGTFYVPHPGFHISTYWLSKITTIPYIYIVPFFIASIIITTILITKKVLIYISPGIRYPILYIFFAITINIVIAIYIPFFSQNKYLGQWSPNIWHNPTMTLLKPFALLGFLGVALFLKDENIFDHVLLILISLCLVVGTYIKPSFIICFLPTIALFSLIYRFKQYRLYFKLFLICLPSILLLIYQFHETYNFNTTESYFHDKIILTWFGVTKSYTKSLTVSTMLVLAFPLSIFVFVNKHIKQNTPLLLSWILTIVSFFISGIFAEQGKFGWGAFISSYIICLFILYVFSLAEYLTWFVAFKKNMLKIIVVGIILSLHVVSGIIYFNGLLNYGRTYT